MTWFRNVETYDIYRNDWKKKIMFKQERGNFHRKRHVNSRGRKVGKISYPRCEKEITAAMFVPASKHSLLFKYIMEAEEKLGPDMDWGVKLVEQSGFPLGRCFVPKFPILAGCPRGVDCIICNNTAVKCSKKGAIYKATCTWCKKGLNMDPTHGGGSVSAGMDGMNNAPIGGEELSNGPVGMDGMNKAPERGGIGGPLCSGEMNDRSDTIGMNEDHVKGKTHNKLISYIGETSRPL